LRHPAHTEDSMVVPSVTSSEKRMGCYKPTHLTGPQNKNVHLIPSKQINENPQNQPEVPRLFYHASCQMVTFMGAYQS